MNHRDHFLRIRLTASELQHLNVAARRNGSAVSTWARDILLQRATPKPKKNAARKKTASARPRKRTVR